MSCACAFWFAAAVWAALPVGNHALRGQTSIRLRALDGQFHDPLARSGDIRVIVLLFLSVDCPVSNRYAPEIHRIQERFSSAGVEVRFIYPNAHDSPGAIRAHVAAYGHRGLVLRDPEHALVERTKVTVTPEAVVFGPTPGIAYRGRIDDRFVSFGVQRPAPTQRNLVDAIATTLAGNRVAPDSTRAIGCYIADFRR